MVLSLAPVRYSRVFAKHGGPLERLAVFRKVSSDGRERHCANGYLRAALRPSWHEEKGLYENADGSGTHIHRNQACYVAISEALERWAFYTESDGSRRANFGFDRDDSTTGMAAFPGLTTRGARKRAAVEAAERWSLVEWWEGRLPARLLPAASPEGALELISPFPSCSVAIVWRRCSFSGLAFGFAGGATLQEAISHARVELDRNIYALETFVSKTGKTPDSVDISGLGTVIERRLVFFASQAGEALFRRRSDESCSMRHLPSQPRTLVDRELPGPWTRYASVWRVLYEPASENSFDETKSDFFSF
jgi:hypothetical protein